MSDNKQNPKPATNKGSGTQTSTATMAAPKPVENKPIDVTVKLELSVRRTEENYGLPGDDKTLHNPKIGSSLKGRAPLSGYDLDEEKKYLPEIIGISPEDPAWRLQKREYWNNISERVPHDDEGTSSKFPGRHIEIFIRFTDKAFLDAYNKADDFDKIGTVLRNADKAGAIEIAPESVPDYTLFRYCLVYGRVANNKKDVKKSAKIWFYLYSKRNEEAKEFEALQLRRRAGNLLDTVMDDETKVNALLRLFKEDPDDEFLFDTPNSKILALAKKVEEKPGDFIRFANDRDLPLKAMLTQAVKFGIVHNPANTQVYYFGDNKEVTLGKTLEDTILYLKSNDEKNKQIKDSIESQLLSFKR